MTTEAPLLNLAHALCPYICAPDLRCSKCPANNKTFCIDKSMEAARAAIASMPSREDAEAAYEAAARIADTFVAAQKALLANATDAREGEAYGNGELVAKDIAAAIRALAAPPVDGGGND